MQKRSSDAIAKAMKSGSSMKGIDPPKKIKRIKPVGQNVGEGGSQGFINAFAGSNQNESKSLARGT